jgi:hypothetical protein
LHLKAIALSYLQPARKRSHFWLWNAIAFNFLLLSDGNAIAFWVVGALTTSFLILTSL